VGKSLENGTQFFKAGTGPAGIKSAATAGALPTTPTSMSLENGTGAKQYFYITLLSASRVNLSQVVFTIKGEHRDAHEGEITQMDSTHGFFFLNDKTTASYAPTDNLFGQLYTNGTTPRLPTTTSASPALPQGIGATLC